MISTASRSAGMIFGGLDGEVGVQPEADVAGRSQHRGIGTPRPGGRAAADKGRGLDFCGGWLMYRGHRVSLQRCDWVDLLGGRIFEALR